MKWDKPQPRRKDGGWWSSIKVLSSTQHTTNDELATDDQTSPSGTGSRSSCGDQLGGQERGGEWWWVAAMRAGVALRHQVLGGGCAICRPSARRGEVRERGSRDRFAHTHSQENQRQRGLGISSPLWSSATRCNEFQCAFKAKLCLSPVRPCLPSNASADPSAHRERRARETKRSSIQ